MDIVKPSEELRGRAWEWANYSTGPKADEEHDKLIAAADAMDAEPDDAKRYAIYCDAVGMPAPTHRPVHDEDTIAYCDACGAMSEGHGPYCPPVETRPV